MRGGFIYEQSTTTGVEYVFKHALTQEVAYNSLLIERRKQLHERAGRALESIFAGQLDDHVTQLRITIVTATMLIRQSKSRPRGQQASSGRQTSCDH